MIILNFAKKNIINELRKKFMCGSLSFSPNSNLRYSKKKLNMSADLIKHRGPDKAEVFK